MVGSGNPVKAQTNCAICPMGINWEGGVGETIVGEEVPAVLEKRGSVTMRMEELEEGPGIPQILHVYSPESDILPEECIIQYMSEVTMMS